MQWKGLSLSVQRQFASQIEMGMETGVSFLRNEISRSYHEEFVNSVTFAMTEDLQLDCGCNIGVTRGAPNINVFSGLSFRF